MRQTPTLRQIRTNTTLVPAPMRLGRIGAELANAFGSMNPDIARAAIERACASGDWKTQTQAALVIGQSGLESDADVQQFLMTLLQNDQKDVRAAAAQVLETVVESKTKEGERPDTRILDSFVPLLRDSNREIAALAADALSKGGWQPPTSEEKAWFLVAAGKGDEAATFGPVAFEPLVHALNADATPAFTSRGNEAKAPEDIIQSLAKLDDPRKIDPLVAALDRHDPRTIENLTYWLGDIGNPKAVEPLISLLGDLNADTRYQAVEALGKLKDPRAVEPLIQLLSDPVPNIRNEVVNALGEIGDPRAAEALRPFLDSEDNSLNTTAVVVALGKLHDAESAPKIAAIYRDINPTLDKPSSYAEALVSIGGPVVEDTFIDMLSHDVNIVKRVQAAEALGRLGSAKAIQPLQDALLFDTEGSVKFASCKALGQIGGEEAARVLSDVVNGQSQTYLNHVSDIAAALSNIDNAISSDALAQIFKDFANILGGGFSQVQFLAAKTLAERGDPRGKPMLEELRGIPESRIDATNALQELERQANPGPEGGVSNTADRSAAPAQKTSQLAGPRLQLRWVVRGDDAKGKTVLPAPTESDPNRTLAVGDDIVLSEADMAKATVKQEEQGTYSIVLQTTDEGAAKLEAATKEYIGKTLAIVFDGQVILAPKVQSSIGKSVSITGQFTREQAEAIARAIHPSDSGEAQQSARLYGPRLQLRWVVEGDDAKGKLILPAPTDSEPDRTLAVGDDVVLYEGGIVTAGVQKEPDSDRYAIRFVTNEQWAKRLHDATEENQGKRLAIIFDGRIVSTPVVRDPFGETGMITGELFPGRSRCDCESHRGQRGTRQG